MRGTSQNSNCKQMRGTEGVILSEKNDMLAYLISLAKSHILDNVQHK